MVHARTVEWKDYFRRKKRKVTDRAAESGADSPANRRDRGSREHRSYQEKHAELVLARRSFFKRASQPINARVRRITKRAFPYSKDGPSSYSQLPGGSPVSSLGVSDFFLPRSGIGPWHNVLTTVMAVPEAAVDKEGHLLTRPREIRFAGQRQVTSPTLQARPAQQMHHPDLRRLVTGTPDAGHEFRTRQVAKRGRPIPSLSGPTHHSAPPMSSALACR
jgi:hypothetical protein